jgi:alcohol dehydrogenase (cytochrome c)
MRMKVLGSLFSISVALYSQGGPPPPAREAPVTPVPYERILKAPTAEPQNWLTYNGGYNSNRYSQLAQITPANAAGLELKWAYQSRSLDKHEVTPLVVDGVMYTVQSPNDVVALNAATGAVIWTYLHKPLEGTHNPCCGNLTRGVAILGDNIYLGSLDGFLIAINAKTGKEVWRTTVGDYKNAYSITHAPLAVKDKILVGVAGGEWGIRGYIKAYDAVTGKELWNFNTVPGPGEAGFESWKTPDSYLHGGAPIWVTGSYDPDTNLTFWGTGNPGPDWNGKARLGDNLYSCSVIALNLDTGKLAWHYQFNPHNEFDWDATQVPVLADIPFQGRTRKAMLWANRNGVAYALDRTNGQFLRGTSFVKTNWYTGFDEKGRPMVPNDKLSSKEGVLIYPGNQGGTNWYNPSFSPATGLQYIPAWENSSTTYTNGEEPPEFHAGAMFPGDRPKGGSTTDDVFGSVIALDPSTGQRKWTYKLSAPSPEGGVMTTAGNLLFAGGRDGQFVALDARDGKEAWSTRLGASVSAGPMTYSVDGKQYISIQSGHTLFTFGLR